VLGNPAQMLSNDSLRGQVWILNVWASWCGACIEEHPVMLRLASENIVPIYGLDYKDRDAQAAAWLDRRGNPYRATLLDPQGRIGLDWGVYGVPETFVIDKAGKVRFKQIGPVTDEVLTRSIRPLLEQLNRE
jgi:cytochrome c biogenesis protein CcmG/thiol:disulfide interchange protein DsbE